jgi:hypothetical protein
MLRWVKSIKDRRAARQFFDAAFYLRTNPDVAAAGVDPLRHYLIHGAREQRQPHPLFDPAHYLGCCPVAGSAGNPLLHFVETRGEKWPSTHPLFDCEAYARAHPDAAGNPLKHYVTHGTRTAVEGSQFGQC